MVALLVFLLAIPTKTLGFTCTAFFFFSTIFLCWVFLCWLPNTPLASTEMPVFKACLPACLRMGVAWRIIFFMTRPNPCPLWYAAPAYTGIPLPYIFTKWTDVYVVENEVLRSTSQLQMVCWHRHDPLYWFRWSGRFSFAVARSARFHKF